MVRQRAAAALRAPCRLAIIVDTWVKYMQDRGMQRFTPMLSYADASGAIDFLTRAFGFAVRFRMDMPDGSIGHAELALGDEIVMLASEWAAGGVVSPCRLTAVHAQIHVRVDDVDAHFARALAAGATLATSPADQEYGERSYRALDPEGHRWIFGAPIAPVAP
jgi:PhnB protein